MWDDEAFDPDEDRRKLEALPIYQKALEILDLTEQIVETFDEDYAATLRKQGILEHARVIPARIAGAEAVNDYVQKMENATLVKIHARSLFTQTSSIQNLGLLDPEYLKLLHDEIESFRRLFKPWVKSFESGTEKEGDGWGLFVPDEEN